MSKTSSAKKILKTPTPDPKPFLEVARVTVRFERVELPRSCTNCGAPFIGSVPDERLGREGCERELAESNLREVNLADTSFVGQLVCLNVFEPDTQTCCQDSGSAWFPYLYECARCGERIAGGEVDVAP